MIFSIGESWRIRSGEYCWMLQRFRGVYKSGRKAGAVKYENVAYHSTLNAAIADLAERMIRELETHGTAEALAGVRRVADEIDNAFDGFAVRLSINSGEKHNGQKRRHT